MYRQFSYIFFAFVTFFVLFCLLKKIFVFFRGNVSSKQLGRLCSELKDLDLDWLTLW